MTRRPAESRRAPAAAALLAILLATGGAAAQDAENGLRLARVWCVGCHLVEPGGGTSDVAPAFELIADNPALTDERLRGWLTAPHPPMPDLSLSQPEISDLVAYIASLRGD